MHLFRIYTTKKSALIILIVASLHVNAQRGSTTATLSEVRSLSSSSGMRLHEETQGSMLFLDEAGKEGYFKYDPADKVSPDNEGTVIVSRSGKRYKRIYDGNLSVAWFGAKGDGVTDDSQAFIKAIAAGDNVVFIPYRKDGYRISNVPVARTVTLRGDNKSNTIIMPANDNVACFLTQATFVEYQDLYFDADGKKNVTGILHQHRISTVESCFFSGFYKGVANFKTIDPATKADEQTIKNSRFRDCFYGVFSEGHFINSKIVNSIFHGCKGSAIFCKDDSYNASQSTTEGLIIESCLIYDSGDPAQKTAAIEIQNLDFTFIRNCIIDLSSSTALSLTNSQNCNISGTYFSAAYATSAPTVRLAGNCSNTSFEGSQFYDSKSWGLEIVAMAERISDNVRINNCSGRLNGKGDVYVNGGTSIWINNSNFYSGRPTNILAANSLGNTSMFIRATNLVGGVVNENANALIDIKDCPTKPTTKAGTVLIQDNQNSISFSHGLTVLKGQKVLVFVFNNTNFDPLIASVTGETIKISRPGKTGRTEVSFKAEVSR